MHSQASTSRTNHNPNPSEKPLHGAVKNRLFWYRRVDRGERLIEAFSIPGPVSIYDRWQCSPIARKIKPKLFTSAVLVVFAECVEMNNNVFGKPQKMRKTELLYKHKFLHNPSYMGSLRPRSQVIPVIHFSLINWRIFRRWMSNFHLARENIPKFVRTCPASISYSNTPNDHQSTDLPYGSYFTICEK